MPQILEPLKHKSFKQVQVTYGYLLKGPGYIASGLMSSFLKQQQQKNDYTELRHQSFLTTAFFRA